jgi:hypothetical protein
VFRLKRLSPVLCAAAAVVAIAAPGSTAAGLVRGETIAAPGPAPSGSIAQAREAAGPQPSPRPGPVGSAGGESLSSSILFDGSNLADYGIESAPNAITEVPDPSGGGETVFKMTVRNSDVYPLTPTENPRAQALSPAMIEPGDEFWLSTKFMIPEGFPYISGWMSLVSIYGPPFEGSSPWQVGVYEHEFRWMREDGRNIPWHTPLVEGKWQTLLLHERFGTDGFVEMWWNGEQLTFNQRDDPNPDHLPEATRLEVPTMDHTNDQGPNSAKIMQYREAGMFGTESIFFGPLAVGLTRASVEG